MKGSKFANTSVIENTKPKHNEIFRDLHRAKRNYKFSCRNHLYHRQILTSLSPIAILNKFVNDFKKSTNDFVNNSTIFIQITQAVYFWLNIHFMIEMEIRN